MTPLVQVRAVDESLSLRACLDEFQRNIQFSKIPVYRGRIDNLSGYIKARDLIDVKDMDAQVRTHMRKPQFVSEFSSLKQLFVLFQDSLQEMVFVVDEYGGVTGILTLEDLLEEIIGEIYDEYDKDDVKSKIRTRGGGWLVPAMIPFESLLDFLGFGDLENTFDAESVGGVIEEVLGKIPAIGEKVALLDLFECEIVEVSPKKIEIVFIKRIDSTDIEG